MLKPIVYLAGNHESEAVRKKLSEVLTASHYQVKEFNDTGNYIRDAMILANKINSNKNRKVGILFANHALSMKDATRYNEGIKNLAINQDTNLNLISLDSANMLSFGVKELSEDEIIQITLEYLKAFLNRLEQQEMNNSAY